METLNHLFERRSLKPVWTSDMDYAARLPER